ncbi:hypothetical protein MMC10_008300 [Thelotrema lepadinum]|nr:hypothetical protein [Thelotrema lepadinum]
MDNNVVIPDTGTELEFGPLATVTWELKRFSELLCNACENNTIDTIDMLLEEWLRLHHADKEPFGNIEGNFNKAVETAITNGRLDVAACLLGKGKGFWVTERVVRSAVKTGSTETLDFLLSHGWDMNQPEVKPSIRYVNTALTLSFFLQTIPKPTSLFQTSAAVLLNSITLVKWFLAHGASANVQPKILFAFSPLSAAASHASFEMVKLLHSHGADPSQDNTVLHTIGSTRKERELVLPYLIQHGAPVNEWKHARNLAKQRSMQHKNSLVQPPLHKAIRMGK